jgi:hypothetical protein
VAESVAAIGPPRLIVNTAQGFVSWDITGGEGFASVATGSQVEVALADGTSPVGADRILVNSAVSGPGEPNTTVNISASPTNLDNQGYIDVLYFLA